MKNSAIAWTDHTFNGWEGCTKVSPGCANCYAEARNARFGGGTAPNWGKGKPRRRTSAQNWNEPKRWNRAAQREQEVFNDEAPNALDIGASAAPARPRVFCASLADWLDDEVPIEWLADLLTLIFDCGFLDWQLLTKRPENFKTRLGAAAVFILNHRDKSERNAAIYGWIYGWGMGQPPHNVWLGTSVEDQARADERIPILLALPAVVRFLSCEPLLDRVTFDETWCNNRLDPSVGKIDWVIVGGESGSGARALAVGWVESLIHECRDAGVKVFVKQLGARPFHDFAGYPGSQVDRGLHLKDPKGGDMDEWPERLRVREFPEGRA